MTKFKDIFNMFTKSPDKVEQEETCIKYVLHNDKMMLSCRCRHGEEKRFAELWLLATADNNSDNILETIATGIDDKRNQLIQNEVKKLAAAKKALQELIRPTSGPIVKPRDVFKDMMR